MRYPEYWLPRVHGVHPYQRQILGELVRHARETPPASGSYLCFPSIARLSRDTDVSRRHVERTLIALREMGFISSKVRHDRHRQISNLYRLNVWALYPQAESQIPKKPATFAWDAIRPQLQAVIRPKDYSAFWSDFDPRQAWFQRGRSCGKRGDTRSILWFWLTRAEQEQTLRDTLRDLTAAAIEANHKRGGHIRLITPLERKRQECPPLAFPSALDGSISVYPVDLYRQPYERKKPAWSEFQLKLTL